MKKALLAIYQELSKDRALEGIAVSCPGRIDSTEGVVYYGGSLTYLHQFPLVAYLEETTGLPVSAINDGKAAALAEKWLGNLSDITNGVALVLGTGLGGGIILGNKLLQGDHFQAGEFSFLLPNDEHPKVDYVAEMRYSPVRMITAIGEVLGLPDKKDGRKVFDYINAKDELTMPTFQQFCKHIAQLIYNVQAIIDTKRVVIGGGISSQSILLEEIERQYLTLIGDLPMIGEMITPVEIKPCRFGGDANLVGALYQLLQK